MKTIPVSVLTDFVSRIFQAAGVSASVAEKVALSLVASNLAGHDSHGVVRVMQYVGAVERGETVGDATPAVTHETAVMATVDARRAFGQVAGAFAMQMAIDKARHAGISAVALHNSSHVGRLGEWVEMAAAEGMIGLAFCNGGRSGGIVAPFGGAARRLGTNPLAAAVPLGNRPPFVLDFATSAVAEGKVRVARNSGKEIPTGWVLDKEGNPTTNPADLYEGGMLVPAAGHKGYALAVLVDLLGGMLTGGGSAPQAGTMQSNGVLFIVLAVSAFRSPEEFNAEAEAMADRIKSAPPAPGFGAVLLPGEPEQQTAAQRRANGVPLDEGTWAQMVAEATRLGVSVPLYG
ncbi:MAG: Ldh family oxidoreductase [Caldilineaceae bacterium]|nr:Ldh family oxidoreductase [Caldilineaceae bacterium]